MDLTQKHCVPCEGGVPPLTPDEANKYLADTLGWEPEGNIKIKRDFKFGNFKEAMAFVNRVADIANAEDHHPDIHVFYSRVILELWTHAIGGLSENDFIVAAKVNALLG